jgi:hypothetical protein
VLSDPEQRMVYDEINGYALTSTNPFLNHAHERDHVFVDEFTCIGQISCFSLVKTRSHRVASMVCWKKNQPSCFCVVDHELDNYCRSSLVQILFWFFSNSNAL